MCICIWIRWVKQLKQILTLVLYSAAVFFRLRLMFSPRAKYFHDTSYCTLDFGLGRLLSNFFDFKGLSQVHHTSLMSFVFCGLMISHPLKGFTIRTYHWVLALPGGKLTSLDLNFKASPSTHGPPRRQTRVTFKCHLRPKTEAIPSQFQVITGLNLYYSTWVSVEIQRNPQPKVGVAGAGLPFT